MKSVCFYSSYFNEPAIPYYVRFYLENLLPYFSEIVFLTNEKTLDEASIHFLQQKNIRLQYVVNEGWDFGMWYKAFQQTDVEQYDRIGLVNDSCVLFKKPAAFFDWLDQSGLDYAGMVDSNAVAYHVQSFFLVINKKAISSVTAYFEQHGLLKNVDEVIKTYEIGLSQYLLKNEFKIGAYYSTKAYPGEFSPMFYMPESLINKGLPLIKKKIVFSSFREKEQLNLMRMKFKLDPRHYIAFIRNKYKADPTLIDFSKVEMPYDNAFQRKLRKYNFKSALFQVIRKLKFLKP